MPCSLCITVPGRSVNTVLGGTDEGKGAYLFGEELVIPCWPHPCSYFSPSEPTGQAGGPAIDFLVGIEPVFGGGNLWEPAAPSP